LKQVAALLLVALVGACGGSSGGFVPPEPFIQLLPTGQGAYASPPVADMLDSVSNDGLGYTGEVDRYTIDAPADGRLMISVSWQHEANFDIIVSRDAQAQDRIAEGLISGFEPEYVRFPVVEGDVVHVFVAGWTGDPGDYTLETLLLPETSPSFALAAPPDLENGQPSNRPIDFEFTQELAPNQSVADQALIVGSGHLAEGEWCIDGSRLRFLPRLPDRPGDLGGLRPGEVYTLQFRRAARGLRAVSGEMLHEVIEVHFEAVAPVDAQPGEPLRVTGTAPSPNQPAPDGEILLVFNEALDPEALDVRMFRIDTPDGGPPAPLDFRFTLEQRLGCNGLLDARLAIAPDGPVEIGAVVAVVVGEQTRSLTGKRLNAEYQAAFAYTSGG